MAEEQQKHTTEQTSDESSDQEQVESGIREVTARARTASRGLNALDREHKDRTCPRWPSDCVNPWSR